MKFDFRFVSLCPNLTYLDVSYCENITGEFLEGVINLLLLRTSKKTLKIRISYSEECRVSDYEEKHPLLELEAYGELKDDSADNDDYYDFDLIYNDYYGDEYCHYDYDYEPDPEYHGYNNYYYF